MKNYNYKHILNIIFILIIIVFLYICVFTNILHFSFFPKKYSESMNTINTSLTSDKYDDFCKIHQGKSDVLEKSCNKLTYENCNKVSCCVHINGNKCVSGSNTGAIYKTEKNGEKINVDYYYYKNKCSGNCKK